MDRVTLSHIDEELESSEVAALCFLCRDVVQKKRLEGVSATYLVLLQPCLNPMSDWKCSIPFHCFFFSTVAEMSLGGSVSVMGDTVYAGHVFCRQNFSSFASILDCCIISFQGLSSQGFARVFPGCSHTGDGCKSAVHETRRKRTAGEPCLPFSAAPHYPSTGSPQSPWVGQQETRRDWCESRPVRLQVKTERNVL